MYGRTITSQVAATVSTSIYTANDVVTELMTFPLQSAGGGGLIGTLLIADDDNEKAAGVLWLFRAAPTSIAANAAFAPTIADLKLLVTKITVTADKYTTINSNAIGIVEDINRPYSTETGALYGYFVCDATPTYTATTDLTFTLTVLAD